MPKTIRTFNIQPVTNGVCLYVEYGFYGTGELGYNPPTSEIYVFKTMDEACAMILSLDKKEEEVN